MDYASIIPGLDPVSIISNLGTWALLGVVAIIFAETALLVGFLLPGDTLLFFTGLLTRAGVIEINIFIVCLSIALAAFIGGEVGYFIGHKIGPKIFERKESGLFSKKNVERTNMFFTRFGSLTVVLARFVPVVRTFTPIAAGVAHMDRSKYTLYNALGATIWGGGLTFLGYLMGSIPWVYDFAEKYIDLVLIGVVIITILPTAYHYFSSVRKARKK